MQNRNQYFDLLKGIAILMVIGIHTFVGGGFISFHEYFNTGIRQVLNCAVPLFIACSGFFLANKKLDDKQLITSFFKKQIARVYIPCLLWSTPWLAFHISGGKSVTIGLLNLVFCGFTVFYFVILMIQYYLLLPVIQVVRSRWGGLLITSIICSLVCVALVMYITAIKGIKVPLILYAGPFPLWIVFFVLGVVLAGSGRNYNLGYIIAGIVLTLILQVIESKWLLLQFQHGVGFGIKPSSFMFSILIIFFVFSKKVEETIKTNNLLNRALVFVGRVSFVVYLSHTLIILVMTTFFPNWDNLLWSARFLIITALDIVLVCTMYCLIPKKLKRYAGF